MNRLRLKIKWWWADLCRGLGLPLKLNQRKGEVQALCFHGVCKDDEPFINARFLHETQCRELLQAIKDYFNIISLDDYIANNLSKDKLNVLITFDDGYLNNRDRLLPIIEQLHIPVTLFVTTRQQNMLWPDLLDVTHANYIALTPLEQAYPELKGLRNHQRKQWIIAQEPAVIEEITSILQSLARPVLTENAVFTALMNKEELQEINALPLVTLANHTANHYDLRGLSP